MYMKLDLAFANWLATISDPFVSHSKLGYTHFEKLMLIGLLSKLKASEFSLFNDSEDILKDVESLLNRLALVDDEESLTEYYDVIRGFLGQKQWIALIIPSGIDSVLDNLLCDPDLLGCLVRSTSNNQGLILQLEDVSNNGSSLLDVHRVLETALNESINWPGILIWSPGGGDSIFLPISSPDFLEFDIEARVQWIFSKLFLKGAFDLSVLNIEYKRAFPEVFEDESKTIKILHLSDLHIGSKKADLRMFQLQQLIRGIVENIGETAKIIPVITGNLMNSPSEKNIEQVSCFWKFLSSMGMEQPLLVFGDNDVRKDGNINESYRNAIDFQNTKVNWYDDEKIAIICINSVVHGNLEFGSVGQEQLEAIEDEFSRKKDFNDYQLIVLIHHHPIQHEPVNNKSHGFYDRVIGESFEQTESIDGANLLKDFIQKYSVSVVLHGHKDIPFLGHSNNNETLIVGCGSSIGKQSYYDGCDYFSVNVLAINQSSSRLSARIMATRKATEGLVESKRHEIFSRKNI